MKKSLSFLLVTVMILSLTACGKYNVSVNTDAQTNSTLTKDNLIESKATGENITATEKSVITVTFRDDGQGENGSLWKWLQGAYDT
ncbi:MAG: transporter substrate-binding protein, partial [Anaerocolumna sp.]|nr:transporter substrate-binding protein [Anaerocolumna sp.]